MKDATLLRFAVIGTAFSLVWLWTVTQTAMLDRFGSHEEIADGSYVVHSGTVGSIRQGDGYIRFVLDGSPEPVEVMVFEEDPWLPTSGLDAGEEIQVKGRIQIEDGREMILADALLRNQKS